MGGGTRRNGGAGVRRAALEWRTRVAKVVAGVEGRGSA